MVLRPAKLCLRADLRAVLTSAAAAGSGEIKAVLALIRQANPEAFHTQETLAGRVFLDQPIRDIPHAGSARLALPKGNALEQQSIALMRAHANELEVTEGKSCVREALAA